jgi:heat shock protein 90kDa beta
VKKLGLDIDSLESEFEAWQRERTTTARADFDEMLKENAFMEFWGRLGKIGGEGVDGGVQADDLGEDEGEGGGGKVDMKALAKSVDVSDMEKVIRVRLTLCDRLFLVFDVL